MHESARGVAHFFLKLLFSVELIMARRIGFVVSDIGSHDGAVAGGDHVRKPVRQQAAKILHAGRVTVDDD